MRAVAWLERASTVMSVLARRRAEDARAYWSRDQLASYQRARLGELVRHATRCSPFYRALYGDLPVHDELELEQLPIVTKSMMMSEYDRFVTDPRLRLGALLRHVAEIRGDELFAREFRVMASSGSSGAKAVYAYDRAAWRGGFATGSMRMGSLVGLRPGLPRPRVATIAAPDGKHMTFRGGASIDIGVFRTLRLSAAAPLAELTATLHRLRPDFIFGYPSVLACLADEQRAGRLQIGPRAVVTSSEVCTPAMATSMREAWGIAPFNCLGLTETGITALDCEQHAGLHVFEDLCIVENVDANNRPVPPRTPGAKILVTNLYNLAQPIIRFEVSDLVTLDDQPCACGRTLQRIIALDGRSDDFLDLPGRDGPIVLHPIYVRSVLGAHAYVLQYQITWDGMALDAEVVLAAGAPAEAARGIERELLAALRARGIEVPVRLRGVAAIAREEGPGKLKHVRVRKLASN